mgnify:CR=1 FL=1
MKIIFLDVDGVLNNQEVFKKHREIRDKTGTRPVDIDDELMDNLKKIVDAHPDTRVVLSSSWRSAFSNILVHGKPHELLPEQKRDPETLYKSLKNRGITMISKTGRDPEGCRGREICEWLDNYAEMMDVRSFIVIDDETFDIDDYLPRSVLVKTSFYGDSLSEDKVTEAIRKLSFELDIDKILENYKNKIYKKGVGKI